MAGTGGFREGAGRKSTGRKKTGFYVTEREEIALRTALEGIRNTNTEPKLMKMKCCERLQAWGKDAGADPVIGEETWCVWCQKKSKIIKIL